MSSLTGRVRVEPFVGLANLSLGLGLAAVGRFGAGWGAVGGWFAAGMSGEGTRRR
jgi:hypothetical protein